MYDEKKFKLTILFTKIRRYVFIFCFVILALVLAYLLSEIMTEILQLPSSMSSLIMVVTGICVFAIGFILTSDLNFKIQEAYMEMKTLKKINLISYKLDKLLEKADISIQDELAKDLDDVNNDYLSEKLKKLKSGNSSKRK